MLQMIKKIWKEASVITLCLTIFITYGNLAVAQQNQIEDQDITLAVETNLVLEAGISAHLVDVTTSEGIVTLSGIVDNILAKEKATEVAHTIKGVRSVVNDIEVRPVARTDQEIKNDVKQALIEDPATESFEVNISVLEGIVTMNGEVDSWQEKQLAEYVVKSVKGVKAVENNIDIIYTGERLDYEIKQDVYRRLTIDPWVDETLIDVAVDDGNVILTGSVGSAQEKRWAESAAWVQGTQKVDAGNLEIQWWAKDEMKKEEKFMFRSDKKIKEAVKDAFTYDPRVAAFDLDVLVEDGVVTIYGMVDNLKAKMAAAEDAQNTIGVIRVKNHVKVRPVNLLGDEEVEEKVRKAIARDPYVELFDVTVTAFNGRVYLEGKVNTLFEKERAEDVVWRVQGVIDVVNNLEFTPVELDKTDWEIKQDVNKQLFWDPGLSTNEITVRVENGIVTLTGEVDNWTERMEAERNAFLAGAKEVRNNLKVEAEEEKLPSEPQSLIE